MVTVALRFGDASVPAAAPPAAIRTAPALRLSMSRRRREIGFIGSTSWLSAERERVGLHAGIQELDRERAVLDRLRLTDQLIQTLLVDHADALRIHVDASILRRRAAVDRHAEAHALAVLAWTEHQMQVARMEAECD